MCRHFGGDRVRFVVETVLDDLERQEVLALLEKHPAQSIDVLLVELAVARRRALGVDQSLAFQEADLRDGDVGELLAQQGQDVTDRQIRARRHRRPSPPAPFNRRSIIRRSP